MIRQQNHPCPLEFDRPLTLILIKSTLKGLIYQDLLIFGVCDSFLILLCWGFTARSTQWGHVGYGQFA